VNFSLEAILTLVAVVATGVATFVSTRYEAKQARKDVGSMRDEMAGALDDIRSAIRATTDLANEALRTARKGHERVDAIESRQAQFDTALGRLDERLKMWLRTTQRLNPNEYTEESGRGR